MANSNKEQIRIIPQHKNKDIAILEKLRHRAEEIGYGTVVCELQIHQNRIKQVEITSIRERMRADYD